MLEKIGLSAKPSMRGVNWVEDASHCQGCSSQFTFFNRKHHCRRCGGLFCNSCTLQRMTLRGQGDSPVRICDPCKQLEEASRFEMRYGHKNRAAKGSKLALKHEDDVLNEILGSDGNQPVPSAWESNADMLSDIQRAVSTASSSNLDVETVHEGSKGDAIPSTSIDVHNHIINEMGSSSPEELRQQALEEKKKYRILKGEGKSPEALQAFKRGKELERQAQALELALRKSRRKASTMSSLAATRKSNNSNHESGRKDNLIPSTSKGEKDDLVAELRELGWSDADMHDTDKKPVKMSLEGELSSLLGEIPRKSSLGRGTTTIDKTQVLAHKKNALRFKREGKLDEAKEELKRAKVLEKQLEEQELLADADESDDELSALIRSMDDDDAKHDAFSLNHKKDPGLDIANLAGVADDLTFDGNFDVTDDDMNDPEIAAALKSFGWTEDANHLENTESESVPVDAEALRSEMLSLKREALNLKRAGNVSQAMEQLKKAILLERDLENLQPSEQSTDTQPSTVVSNSKQMSLNTQTDNENDEIVTTRTRLDKAPPKSKLAIQRELLVLKKKALALRREGRMDEAEEELKKGKVLEHQLEELENAPKAMASKASIDTRELDPYHQHLDVMGGDEVNVTEQDMHDPALLSVLKNLGWDDEVETMSKSRKSFKEIDISSEHSTNMRNEAEIPDRKPKSKAEIQKELLSIKRKALAFRRQGKLEEAEEELRKAKVLEDQVAELEVSSQKEQICETGFLISLEKHENIGAQTKGNVVDSTSLIDEVVMVGVSMADMKDIGLSKAVQDMGSKESDTVQPPLSSSISISENITNMEKASNYEVSSAPGLDSQNDHSTGLQAVLALKRQAVALKREGKLAEAREELRQAKLLEKSLGAALNADAGNSNIPASTSNDISYPLESSKNQAPKPASSRDRFKLQQESLAHKRQALKLRREGRMEESEAEFELAKALETQLEEMGTHDQYQNKLKNKADTENDVGVEDLLDPQLLSALKAIGWQDVDIVDQAPQRPEAQPSLIKSESTMPEKGQLEEQIKAEKVRALNLKRAGKQAEALDALRHAKQLEKKLNSLPS
ncbi:hypothetical protein MRB53_021377 [Persea americana]|uniref:Uncharacterized protein n=1 Tax=Persea americana TaxID=3435 RepID=A0ACC2L486_PERAE|nr:hypothetical protein MRB53_021377 [Persea americana]